MLLRENILLALEGLKANKMRSLLTMLGIIIGIGSVISIMSIGDAVQNALKAGLTESFRKIEVKVVQKEEAADLGIKDEKEEDDLLTGEMIERFIAAVGDSVLGYSVYSSHGESSRAQDGMRYTNIIVSGIDEKYGEYANTNIDILDGRFLRKSDVEGYRNSVLIPESFRKNVFPGRSAVGKEISFSLNDSEQTFVIAGVYRLGKDEEKKDGEKETAQLYIPITTFNSALGKPQGKYESFSIAIPFEVDEKEFIKSANSYFNIYYRNNENYKVEATVGFDELFLTIFSQMTGALSIGLSVIAAISLLVGSIGVMNIMLVSVTERTREIGTLKALGARRSAIMMQFIVESIIICGIGGAIGMAFGVTVGYIVSLIAKHPSLPNIGIVLIAFSVSTAVGVLSGWYPADKAAKLDPIEALRYE